MEKESNRAQSGKKRKATGTTPLRQVERKLIKENMERPSRTSERSVISFPMEAAEEDTIFLKLKKLNSQNMYYRLSSKMPMHTLFLDYCFRMGLLYEETKFAHNNSRVLESHSAGELKMSASQVHTIFVFTSREDPFIDLRSQSPGLTSEKDPSMFLTLKPFGNGEDSCYSYKYSRCKPLNQLMVDYCQRRDLKAQNVCFFYSTDSSQEDIGTPKGAKAQEEKHYVIYVLPAAESASSTSPNTLQMNECDVLSTTCFNTSKRGESNGGVAAEKEEKCLEKNQEEDREDVSLLTVKVVSVMGKVCYYKMSRDTPLCWVLLHYRDLKGFQHDRVRFVSEKDGKSLSIDDAIAKTAKEVKRDNQYVIRAIPCNKAM